MRLPFPQVSWEKPCVTRLHALLIVVALWAAIFLPGLGAIELKGEEGRRVLPAVTMLETGDWIVPYVGGEPYLRKPPLIHWLIAASFRVTGARDNFAARLPSALGVLALAVALVGVGSAWLTPGGALLAAIFAMTNLGMLEKGRLAELEALYISMTGIALICWLAWWRDERSPWLVWTVPFVFLGLGLLTKAPLHLLYFYAVVVGVLWRAKRLRDLRCAPHFVGVVLMLAIFAAWAVPYLQAVAKLGAANVWTEEFAGRVAHSKTNFALWTENFWNNYKNFLPWLLFVPLWWNRRVLDAMPERDAAIFRGTRLAVVLCGCGLILIPGVLSRYTLPLVVPASLLTALALGAPNLLPLRVLPAWRVVLLVLFGVVAAAACTLPFVAGHHGATLAAAATILLVAAGGFVLRGKFTTPPALAIGTATAIALGVLIFVAGKVPRIIAAEKNRPMAQGINAALPGARELYVVDPGYQPALFYIRPRCIYFKSPADLPPQGGAVLVRAEAQKKLARLGRATRVLAQFKDSGGSYFLLLEVAAAGG